MYSILKINNKFGVTFSVYIVSIGNKQVKLRSYCSTKNLWLNQN